MIPAAATAAPSTTNTHRRPKRRRSASCRRSPAISALIPTTHAPAPDRERRVAERSFHARVRPRLLARVDLGRFVVGAVLDQDAIRLERRIAGSDSPVPLAHDRRAFLEEVGRVADVVDASPSSCRRSRRSARPGDVSSIDPRHDRAREAEPIGALVLPVVHGLGHGAEVDDVVRQHDREQHDRDDRDDTTTDRDDVATTSTRRGAERTGAQAVTRRPSLDLDPFARATTPRRASCAARSRASSRR